MSDMNVRPVPCAPKPPGHPERMMRAVDRLDEVEKQFAELLADVQGELLPPVDMGRAETSTPSLSMVLNETPDIIAEKAGKMSVMIDDLRQTLLG